MWAAAKTWVGIVFALTALWLVVKPVLAGADPPALLGPAIGGVVVLGAWHVLQAYFPE